jgi:hypothetical protein
MVEKWNSVTLGENMPYINAELLKRRRLRIKNYEYDVEVNKQEDVKAHLSYSAGLTLQEVATGLKLIASLPNIQGEIPRANDPQIPYFKKMDVVARDVRGPYIISDSHRHRAQRLVLSNGHGQYEI